MHSPNNSMFIIVFCIGVERVLVAIVNATGFFYINNESSESVWPGNNVMILSLQ